MTDLVFARRVESLWVKSRRLLVTLRWCLANFKADFLLLFEVSFLRLCCLLSRLSFFSARVRGLGGGIFSPSDVVINEVSPTSIPTASPLTSCGGSISLSTVKLTNHRSACLETVADKILPWS